MKVKVYKTGYGDWIAESGHFVIWTYSWEDAMSAAWGHIAMRHS